VLPRSWCSTGQRFHVAITKPVLVRPLCRNPACRHNAGLKLASPGFGKGARMNYLRRRKMAVPKSPFLRAPTIELFAAPAELPGWETGFRLARDQCNVL